MMEWHDPVIEKPPVEKNVLLSIGGQYTAEGCLRKDGKWTQYRWEAILKESAVTAWAYMPSPVGFEKDITLIFTFGDGQEHAGHFVRITGTDREDCRKQMFEKFGEEWAFCYTEEEWERWQKDKPFWCPIETELEGQNENRTD